MSKIKTVLQYILAIILAFCILIIVFINIFSSTILKRGYIEENLIKENYYNRIYENAKSNFENYIYQSGLDENVLNDIISENKVENDTKIILNNIYNGTNEEISTEKIREKLNQNIEQSIGNNISKDTQDAINTFVNTICEEYKNTITHTKYESVINEYYSLIMDCIKNIRKTTLVIILEIIVLLVFLTYRRIHRLLARIGLACSINGLIFLIAAIYINLKVKIKGITIFNEAISSVIRNIIKDILNKMYVYGWWLLIVGIALIVGYALISNVKKLKRKKEEYMPEI